MKKTAKIRLCDPRPSEDRCQKFRMNVAYSKGAGREIPVSFFKVEESDSKEPDKVVPFTSIPFDYKKDQDAKKLALLVHRIIAVKNNFASVVGSNIPDEFTEAMGMMGSIGELDKKMQLAKAIVDGKKTDPLSLLGREVSALEGRMKVFEGHIRSGGCKSKNTSKPVDAKPKKGLK